MTKLVPALVFNSHEEKQMEEVIHRFPVLWTVSRDKPKSNQPEEVKEVLEQNLSAVMPANVRSLVLRMGQH